MKTIQIEFFRFDVNDRNKRCNLASISVFTMITCNNTYNNKVGRNLYTYIKLSVKFKWSSDNKQRYATLPPLYAMILK